MSDPLAWMDDEQKHALDWNGDYNGEACTNCGRLRVMLCSNGKRLCEKCRWSPEEDGFVGEWD